MKESSATTPKLFIIGVVLIITFSLLSAFLNFGLLYLFGLPVVPILIGLVLVWISAEPTKKKVLVSVLTAFPPIAIGFALLLLSWPRAEPETYLLPNDYRGPFVVVLSCGVPIPYENGRRIYNIPESGVLVLSGKYNDGVIDRRFFIVGADGSRTQLPEVDYSSFDEEASSMKWRFSRENLTKDTLGVFWGDRTYHSFIISNYATLERQTESEKEDSWRVLHQKMMEGPASINCRH